MEWQREGNLSQKKPLGLCSPESLKFPRKKDIALLILVASFVWIFLFSFLSVSWQCRWPLALRGEVLLELDVELVIWAAAFWRGSQEKYWSWLHSPGSEVTWLVWTSIILGYAAGISGWCHAKQVAWEPKGTAVGNMVIGRLPGPKNILFSYKCVVFVGKHRRRSS